MTVADEGTIEFIECILPVLIRYADACSLEIAGIGPSFVPGRFPEVIIGLTILAHQLINNAQIEQRLAIVGVWIATFLHLNGGFEIAFGLIETGTAQVPQAHLHVAAVILGIAAQSLLVVIERAPGGVAILLKVQTCEVKLIDRLGILWRERSLGSIGDRTNLVILGIPL